MLFAARALQGAFGALLAPAALSLLTVTFTEAKERAQGVRRLRRDLRRRRRHRPDLRRRADRVRELALVPAGQHPDRGDRVRRGTAARPGEPGARQHPLRHPRRGARRPAAWSRWSTASPRPRPTAGAPAVTVELRSSPPRCCSAGFVVVGVASHAPAAAAARGHATATGGPRTWCRSWSAPALLGHVPVHDVLPAADAGLLGAQERLRVPAVLRGHHRRGRHRRAVAAAGRAAGC